MSKGSRPVVVVDIQQGRLSAHCRRYDLVDFFYVGKVFNTARDASVALGLRPKVVGCTLAANTRLGRYASAFADGGITLAYVDSPDPTHRPVPTPTTERAALPLRLLGACDVPAVVADRIEEFVKEEGGITE